MTVITEKEMLDRLSKKELIDIILKPENELLREKIISHVINRCCDEIKKILDAKEKLDLSIFSDRMKYQKLEEKYEKFNRIIEGYICDLSCRSIPEE